MQGAFSSMRRISVLAVPLMACLAFALVAGPQEAGHDSAKPVEAKIAPASKEAQQATGRIRVPKGLKVELFAAEPLLANPVAFCFDEKGRCYVAETYRLHKGVTDNRGHPSKWTDDDLAARTVADRLALYKKHLGAKYDTYGGHDDRIRLLEDTDG